VEGENTPEVKVFANDVFPPAVPTGLQAVFSGPGQAPFVDVIWKPDTESDLAGYDIYRREEDGSVRKLNSELIQVPAFRDTEIVPGRIYSYSVTAVDTHGNESARSEEAAERVP
jgi:fibronectin type 3 domain-containing protein